MTKSGVWNNLGDVADYLAAVLVIIGWLVLYRQSLAIKRREELSAYVKQVAESIEEILRLCEEYYSQENGNHISMLSSTIKGRFQLLNRYLLILNRAGLNLSAADKFVRFKMLATGSHFETVDFRNQVRIPNWQQDLVASALDLRFEAESAYFSWCNKKLGDAFR